MYATSGWDNAAVFQRIAPNNPTVLSKTPMNTDKHANLMCGDVYKNKKALDLGDAQAVTYFHESPYI